MTSQAVEIPGYIAGTWDLDPVHSTTEFGITFNAPVPGSSGVMVNERIQIEAEAVLGQEQQQA